MNHCVPEKINRTFNDKCIAYKSKSDVYRSIYYYLEMIRPWLGNMTDDLRAFGERKIYLIMKTNFMSSKDSDESLCILTVITYNI